jgi:hypothetical protein
VAAAAASQRPRGTQSGLDVGSVLSRVRAAAPPVFHAALADVSDEDVEAFRRVRGHSEEPAPDAADDASDAAELASPQRPRRARHTHRRAASDSEMHGGNDEDRGYAFLARVLQGDAAALAAVSSGARKSGAAHERDPAGTLDTLDAPKQVHVTRAQSPSRYVYQAPKRPLGADRSTVDVDDRKLVHTLRGRAPSDASEASERAPEPTLPAPALPAASVSASSRLAVAGAGSAAPSRSSSLSPAAAVVRGDARQPVSVVSITALESRALEAGAMAAAPPSGALSRAYGSASQAASSPAAASVNARSAAAAAAAAVLAPSRAAAGVAPSATAGATVLTPTAAMRGSRTAGSYSAPVASLSMERLVLHPPTHPPPPPPPNHRPPQPPSLGRTPAGTPTASGAGASVATSPAAAAAASAHALHTAHARRDTAATRDTGTQTPEPRAPAPTFATTLPVFGGPSFDQQRPSPQPGGAREPVPRAAAANTAMGAHSPADAAGRAPAPPQHRLASPAPVELQSAMATQKRRAASLDPVPLRAVRYVDGVAALPGTESIWERVRQTTKRLSDALAPTPSGESPSVRAHWTPAASSADASASTQSPARVRVGTRGTRVAPSTADASLSPVSALARVQEPQAAAAASASVRIASPESSAATRSRPARPASALPGLLGSSLSSTSAAASGAAPFAWHALGLSTETSGVVKRLLSRDGLYERTPLLRQLVAPSPGGAPRMSATLSSSSTGAGAARVRALVLTRALARRASATTWASPRCPSRSFRRRCRSRPRRRGGRRRRYPCRLHRRWP